PPGPGWGASWFLRGLDRSAADVHGGQTTAGQGELHQYRAGSRPGRRGNGELDTVRGVSLRGREARCRRGTDRIVARDNQRGHGGSYSSSDGKHRTVGHSTHRG